MRCARVLRKAAKPLTETPFGKYDLLRPPKIRKSAPAGYTPPSLVPGHIRAPPYVPVNFFTRSPEEELREIVDEGEGYHGEDGVGNTEVGMIALGGVEERTVRYAGGLVAEILEEVGKLVQPGISTSALDKQIHELIVAKNAYPSPLGYQGYPKSVTTSVNNVICHGIPDDRILLPTDIINIDVTIYTSLPSTSHPGSTRNAIHVHGDSSITFPLPDVDSQGRELVEITQEALDIGLKQCGPGRKFRDIGCAIEAYVRQYGYSVNQQFTGHGIGQRFHTAPWILHHANDEPGTMRPGHCFTIEPCVVQGDWSRGYMWNDGWTFATESNARSAQFEHQVLITENGAEVLTRRKSE